MVDITKANTTTIDTETSHIHGRTTRLLGYITVHVTHKTLPLLVVAGSGPSLFGRDCLQKIRLDWQAIHNLQGATKLQTLLPRHTDILKDKLECVKGFQASIVIESKAAPWFCKPRTVPFALKTKVKK